MNYIHGDRFREVADFVFDEESTPDITGDGIVFFHTHRWADVVKSLSGHKHVFVSHNSDESATIQMMAEFRSRCQLIHWYAQNPSFQHRDLSPIPIGLERPGYGECNDTSKLVTRHNRNHNIYMNFNIATNPAERRECYDIIKIYPGVLDDMRTGRRITFEEHCRRMSSCKFVASPPGNGLDCIRTWEALYQGVIPIVKRSPLDPLFNRLPVLIVDRWTDLFFLDLEEEWQVRHDREWYVSLDASNWQNTIKLRMAGVL